MRKREVVKIPFDGVVCITLFILGIVTIPLVCRFYTPFLLICNPFTVLVLILYSKLEFIDKPREKYLEKHGICYSCDVCSNKLEPVSRLYVKFIDKDGESRLISDIFMLNKNDKVENLEARVYVDKKDFGNYFLKIYRRY